MAYSITVTARKLIALGELVTSGKLNLAQFITLTFSGTAATADIADRAVTSAKAENFGAWFEGTDSGNATAHAVAITSGVSAYATGMMILYKVNTTNTGAVNVNVTPSVSGTPIGSKDIFQPNGQELLPGMLRAGSYALIRYDGTQFQLLGCTDLPPTRYVETTGSANAYVATFGAATGYPTAATLAQLEGRVLLLKASFANTGAATLVVDGLAPKAIRKDNDLALASGDLKDNQILALVYDSAANSAAGAFLLLSPVATPATPPTLVALTRNLVIQNNAGTPNSQVDVDADDVLLTNSSEAGHKASAVNLTIDIAVGGANGLDTGAENPDAWYYVWVIYNSTTDTVAGLLSTSSTAPVLPTNYDYKALVGAVRNTSGNFVAAIQTERAVSFALSNVFNNKDSLTTWAVLSGADLTAFQALVPPIAKTATVVAGHSAAVVSGNAYAVAVGRDANGLGAQLFGCYPQTSIAAFEGFIWGAAFKGVPLASQNFAWKTGAAETGKFRLSVSGYTL